MYYLIKETLIETDIEECIKRKAPYVAVLDQETFNKNQDRFGFIIDVAEEEEKDASRVTKAEVNYDSLTGSFAIPVKAGAAYSEEYFEFVLDENGIVFIDDSECVKTYLDMIKRTKKWRMPSLERFLFDFVETITKKDLSKLQKYENEMDGLENRIANDLDEEIVTRISEIRGELADLRLFYEQLFDVCKEFEENENNFFATENLRYFRLAEDRLQRLMDLDSSLREYTMQLRDQYHYQLEAKQNKVITLLTVVTTIFMPLTLIAGWYGMNFYNMPELRWEYGYAVIIGVSIIITIIEIIFFKKKKWL
jgi:magnesium transporter